MDLLAELFGFFLSDIAGVFWKKKKAVKTCSMTQLYFHLHVYSLWVRRCACAKFIVHWLGNRNRIRNEDRERDARATHNFVVLENMPYVYIVEGTRRNVISTERLFWFVWRRSQTRHSLPNETVSSLLCSLRSQSLIISSDDGQWP